MAANNKNVNCAQVNDLGAAIKQYERQGCSVKWEARSGCAMIECRDSNTFVCPTPRSDHGTGQTPHDEMDEAYQDYWSEIPS